MRSSSCGALVLVALFSNATCFGGITLRLLPMPAGAAGGSYASAVSADGSVIVGGAGSLGARWSGDHAEVAPFPLGAVSGDGRTAVGNDFTASPFHALRWTDDGVSSLGITDVFAINYDGSVTVGWTEVAPSNSLYACRQSSSGVEVFGTAGSRANGVSADGSVVVGTYYPDPSTSTNRAFRWTGQELQDLGTLPGYSDAYAYGVAADGTRVVGKCWAMGQGYRSFVWTAGQGMVDLGLTPGAASTQAEHISADGRVVIGQCNVWTGMGYELEPFVWVEGEGIMDFRALLGGAGVDLSEWTDLYLNGCSADGLTIVGTGYRSADAEAFVVTTPAPSAGIVLLMAAAGASRRKRQVTGPVARSERGF